MRRKILKYILITLGCILGSILIVLILLYTPPVQNFIKKKAVSYVTDNLGMNLGVDRLRIKFPLTLELNNSLLSTPRGDTILFVRELNAGIKVFPLLKKEVRIGSLLLEQAVMDYQDAAADISLRGTLGRIALTGTSVKLKNSSGEINSIDISDGYIRLLVGADPLPDTTVKDTLPVLWKFDADKISLNKLDAAVELESSSTRIAGFIENATVKEPHIDLGNKTVSLFSFRIDNGKYNIVSGIDTAATEYYMASPGQNQTQEETSGEWEVTVANFILSNNSFNYDASAAPPKQGFDSGHIEAKEIDIWLDSVYYGSKGISVSIADISMKERSGLTINSAKGNIRIDTAAIDINSFEVNTAVSVLRAEARIGNSASNSLPDRQLRAAVSGRIGSQDIGIFLEPGNTAAGILSGSDLTLNGNFSGTLRHLEINTLDITLPPVGNIHAGGYIDGLTEPAALAGNIRFRADMGDLDRLKGFIGDTALRVRIAFPDRFTASGSFGFTPVRYSPDVEIRTDSGQLKIKGYLDTRIEQYTVSVVTTDFPLYEFLPKDSLGIASLSLQADGVGFDIPGGEFTTDIDISVERLDFNRYSYTNMDIDLSVVDHIVQGTIISKNPALDLDLTVDGSITSGRYEARLSGDVNSVDLYSLYFTTYPLGGSMSIDATASVAADSVYNADIIIDTLRLTHRKRTDAIGRSELHASSDYSRTFLNMSTGDLTLDFDSPRHVNAIISMLHNTGTELQRQIDTAYIDMYRLQQALPPFRLTATAGRRNVLNDILADNNMGFSRLELGARTDSVTPLRAGVIINGYCNGSLILDTLNIGVIRRDDRLNYYTRLRNRPGNIEQMALIRVNGSLSGNSTHAEFLQRDRANSIGFRFGIDGTLADSSVQLNIADNSPVFGYEQWSVNADNYLTWHFDKRLDADIRLEGDDKHVYIQSTPMRMLSDGAVHFDMAGIDIGNTMRLFPSPIPLDGTLSTDITIGFDESVIAIEGGVEIENMFYDQGRIGTFALDVDFQSDSIRQRLLDAELTVNDTSVLVAKGTFLSEDKSMDFTADITSFPLKAVNAFIPDRAVVLSGKLDGSLSLTGTTTDSDLDGVLSFDNTDVTIPVLGTTYRISGDPVNMQDSRISFDNFSILSPGNEPLTLEGYVDITDFSRIFTDLSLYASDFEVINSTHNSQPDADAFGKATIDVDITARGYLDALSVRGDIDILSGTDVTYILRDNNTKAESMKQNIVTFVSFADTASYALTDTLSIIKGTGMDIQVNIEIEEGVQAAIYLSEDGNNRIELTGDGLLSYSMNNQGDMRFTGRYIINKGTVVYNPPVISQKTFTINDGSYVEWNGEIGNPSFNITAVETVSTTVTGEDGASSSVDFNITVTVTNTLEDLAIVFDLAAPNDLAIQNQLASLAPEQRSQQAMALLVYNTYTGPGTTATVDATNPLNSLIERELNQWARNSLSGVDVAFGINDSDGADGSHTDYTYRVSKSLFDDRVKVTVGGTLNPDDSSNDDLKENFVDDISLEYRLNARDNMFLKAYRYNTQESILEGEVVETGFGYVVRKKVNKLSELFRLRRTPEKKKARELQKEIRRDRRREEEDSVADPAKEQRQDNPLDVNNEESTQYSDMKILIAFAISASAIILSGCSTTKRLTDDQVLYTGVKKIKIETYDGEKVPSSVAADVKSPLNVKPNNPLYSPYIRTPLPIGLWVWNYFYTEQRKGFKYWIYRRFAKKPVLMSDVRPELRTVMVTDILDNLGYFGSSASYEIIPKKNPKKARVSYSVGVADPWTYSSVDFPDRINRATGIISTLQPSSNLVAGAQYNVDTMTRERIRITNYLRNHGYYYFRPNYIEYLADTLREHLKVDLKMKTVQGVPEAALRPYRTGSITVDFYNPVSSETDTVWYEGIRIRYQKPLKLRPKELLLRLRITKGDTVRVESINNTLTNLNKLGIFRYVNLNVTPLDSLKGSEYIDMNITAAFDTLIEASFEADFASKSNSFIGPGAIFSVKQKNLFYGGEVLDIRLNGSYEWQTGNTRGQQNTGSINSYELGATASLTFPCLVAPGFIPRSKKYDSKTTYQLGASLLNRPKFFKTISYNGSTSYDFQTSPYSFHNLTLFKIVYNRLLSTTPEFDSVMLDNPSIKLSFENQFIPSASYTYTFDHGYGRQLRDRFIWQSTFTTAGNILAGAYGIFGASKPKKISGNRFSQFLKGITELRYYHQVGKKNTIASRLTIGAGYAYGNSTVLPYSEQFYIGGANSLRAFTIRSIGPGSYRPDENDNYGYFDQTGDFKLEANVEYRINIAGGLNAAVFLDAGNIWLLRNDDTRPGGQLNLRRMWKEIGLGTGAGIRYDITYLVIRADLGIGIHVLYKNGFYNIDRFKDGLGFHLAIGYPF